MTVKKRLLDEFECAINAVFGDEAEQEFDDVEFTEADLDLIVKKVKFYMDLD